MKIVLTDSRKVSQFACILRHLKNISSNIELLFTNEKLYTQGMDSAHASLFELNLLKEWFSEYEMEKDETYSIGINCEILFKILNCFTDTENIEINYTKNSDFLNFILNARKGTNGIRKEFNIPLLVLETELMDIPDTEWEADLKMVSDIFSTLVGELGIFSDELIIKCDDDIKMTGKGATGSMNAVIKEENILQYAIAEDTELNVKYAMNYVIQFAGFSKVNKEVNIHFSKDKPMKIQYNMDDVMDEDDDDDEKPAKNFIRFFLAPKFDD